MANEQLGIAAYIPVSECSTLEDPSNMSPVSLLYKPGDESVQFVVKKSDIRQIIFGEPQGESRLVQLLLIPGAFVETRIKMLRDVRNLQDPTLRHLTAPAVSTVSSLPTSA